MTNWLEVTFLLPDRSRREVPRVAVLPQVGDTVRFHDLEPEYVVTKVVHAVRPGYTDYDGTEVTEYTVPEVTLY